jgi:hypothetical protein
MRVSIPRITALTLSVVLAAAIAGCGGGSADVKSVVSTTKTGQQLADLKKAFDSGAITKEQYDTEKARLLTGN